ncbi:MAG: FixH family protein [Wenzhouxiangellaceae bacterium]|nr:FixH family protein [Wenzhouxiangellaceae bacterium]
MIEDEPDVPWYRQFWPWFLLAVLAWGIVSASITLAVAVGNPPQMMKGDYARLGKVLVDTHVRADRAESLGLAGHLTGVDGRLRLELAARDASAVDDSLLLLVQHPVDAARDRQLLLRRVGATTWLAETEDLPPRGRVVVSDPGQTWWISSSFAGDADRLDVRLVPERL